MASKKAIAELLRTVEALGLVDPRRGAPAALVSSDPEERAEATRALLEAWHRLFRRVDDDQLAVAVDSYLSDPEGCRWFPQPGQILARVPPRRPRLRLVGGRDAADAEPSSVPLPPPPTPEQNSEWADKLRREVLDPYPIARDAEMLALHRRWAGREYVPPEQRPEPTAMRGETGRA